LKYFKQLLLSIIKFLFRIQNILNTFDAYDEFMTNLYKLVKYLK